MAGHKTDSSNRPLIFISAAEPSADRHGASLIQAARILAPDARFVGVAGPRMVAAGCEALYPMERLAVIGLLETFVRAQPQVFGVNTVDPYHNATKINGGMNRNSFLFPFDILVRQDHLAVVYDRVAAQDCIPKIPVIT